MSISKIFDIAKNSLYVYQKALSVTSNNIANADNENYSRQRINFSALQSDHSDRFGIGSGVTISSIQRIKNQFTEIQIRNYSQSQGNADKRYEILSNIESLLSETTDNGLSQQLNNFFDSWTKLTSDPTSIELRNNVVTTAQNFSDKLQDIYEGLNTINTSLIEDTQNSINEINKSVAQIKTLNQQIFSANVNGSNANELLDERDKLINELSKFANINVTTDKDNMVSVSIGGVYAVDRYNANQFKIVSDGNTISVQTADGQAKLAITGGSLGAIIEANNKNIPSYRQDLDSIANALMNSVNTIHETGYTNTNPKLTGIKFFDSYETGKLSINPNILNDVNYISTSSDGNIGNSDIAVSLAALADSKVMGSQTITEKYSGFVSKIANGVSESSQNSDSYSIVLQQLGEQKASYSGVSTDEETVNILQFQKSYEAAAKLITVANQLFDTLLQMV
jgi:flagellar hook-associated protein 1